MDRLVENKAAVLGFVGAPFTLASYVVEGGSSKHFTKIKRLAFSQPKSLSPVDFEEFSLPYMKQIVDAVKQSHPNLPLILYASGSGGLLERLALTGVDVVSLDWSVDMAEGRKRLGPDVAVQGNVDPGVLFGSKEFITNRINDVVKKAGKGKHILNLGHGIVVGTPEENVAHFFEFSKADWQAREFVALVFLWENVLWQGHGDCRFILFHSLAYHHLYSVKFWSVAIKVIDKEKVLKVGLMDQIKREISVMRLVKHPNVLQLYEVMATKNKIYFVIEYAKGGELFNKVAKGRLKEDVARTYFQLLISAMIFVIAEVFLTEI
ncbi:hypothetical protein NC652_041022 [Populus alba x Populus x berolinensis]|nr:hypothetical protein NC652_041022 [Populus alba x Populus x berolinensis]